MIRKLLTWTVISILYVILAYPMFYFSFKYFSPEISGQIDYYDYYILYQTMDYSLVNQPFNMRLISSFFVHTLHDLGLNYPVSIAFDDVRYDQSVFFNALIVNCISAVLTCVLIFKIVIEKSEDYLLSFFAGSIYLLQYGTLFWGANGLVDTFSALLFTICFYLFINKSYYLILFLIISIFQRDIILIAMSSIAFIAQILGFFRKEKVQYYSVILFVSLVSFGALVFLRETVFFTSDKWSGYTEASYYSSIFSQPRFELFQYLRGSIFSQNILFIYLLVILYKVFYKKSIMTRSFLFITGFFLVMHSVCFITHVLHETGRYFFIASSMIPIYLALELKDLKIRKPI